MKCVTEGRRK